MDNTMEHRRINDSEVANLNTIIRAAEDGNLSLVVVRERSSGEERVALAAIGHGGAYGQEYAITPFALMVDGNPFELLDPPDPDGGYHEDHDDEPA